MTKHVMSPKVSPAHSRAERVRTARSLPLNRRHREKRNSRGRDAIGRRESQSTSQISQIHTDEHSRKMPLRSMEQDDVGNLVADKEGALAQVGANAQALAGTIRVTRSNGNSEQGLWAWQLLSLESGHLV